MVLPRPRSTRLTSNLRACSATPGMTSRCWTRGVPTCGPSTHAAGSTDREDPGDPPRRAAGKPAGPQRSLVGAGGQLSRLPLAPRQRPIRCGPLPRARRRRVLRHDRPAAGPGPGSHDVRRRPLRLLGLAAARLQRHPPARVRARARLPRTAVGRDGRCGLGPARFAVRLGRHPGLGLAERARGPRPAPGRGIGPLARGIRPSLGGGGCVGYGGRRRRRPAVDQRVHQPLQPPASPPTGPGLDRRPGASTTRGHRPRRRQRRWRASRTELDRIVEEFAFDRRGWRLIRQKNLYLGASRNALAREARGDYILFMDDDNVAKPHELATFARVARHTDGDVFTCLLDMFEGNESALGRAAAGDTPSPLHRRRLPPVRHPQHVRRFQCAGASPGLDRAGRLYRGPRRRPRGLGSLFEVRPPRLSDRGHPGGAVLLPDRAGKHVEGDVDDPEPSPQPAPAPRADPSAVSCPDRAGHGAVAGRAGDISTRRARERRHPLPPAPVELPRRRRHQRANQGPGADAPAGQDG